MLLPRFRTRYPKDEKFPQMIMMKWAFRHIRFLGASFLVLGIASYLSALPAVAIETTAKQAILIDATTGAVLLEKNADDRVPPSSMSKMMTVYMVFERLKEKSLSLDDTFVVSRKAWKKGGSKMFVDVGLEQNATPCLQRVLRRAPEHQEARRLLAVLRKAPPL